MLGWFTSASLNPLRVSLAGMQIGLLSELHGECGPPHATIEAEPIAMA